MLTTLEFNIFPLINYVGIMASTFSSTMAVAAGSHTFNAKTVWGGEKSVAMAYSVRFSFVMGRTLGMVAPTLN